MQDLKRNVGISTVEGMGTKASQKNPQALFIVVFGPDTTTDVLAVHQYHAAWWDTAP